MTLSKGPGRIPGRGPFWCKGIVFVRLSRFVIARGGKWLHLLQIETFGWAGVQFRYIPASSTASSAVTTTPIPMSSALSGRELAYLPMTRRELVSRMSTKTVIGS